MCLFLRTLVADQCICDQSTYLISFMVNRFLNYNLTSFFYPFFLLDFDLDGKWFLSHSSSIIVSAPSSDRLQHLHSRQHYANLTTCAQLSKTASWTPFGVLSPTFMYRWAFTAVTPNRYYVFAIPWSSWRIFRREHLQTPRRRHVFSGSSGFACMLHHTLSYFYVIALVHTLPLSWTFSRLGSAWSIFGIKWGTDWGMLRGMYAF